MAEGDTFVNSIIGAVATVILSAFVPLSPLFGGGVGGYLQGGSKGDAMKVGAIAGVIALIPILVVMFFVANLFLVAVVSVPDPDALLGGGVALGVTVVILLFSAIYSIGLSAVGGYLGHYVKYETDVDL